MSREFRHIIRVADTDLDGTRKVGHSLSGIKGIGTRLANVIAVKAGVDPEARLGVLSDDEVERIEDVIKDPSKHGVPSWFLNRAKDVGTGRHTHLVGPSLDLQAKFDVEEMKKVRSWRGYRHAYGLKARGQRTRTTGRTKKSMVVKRKRGR